jgi:hypothetical protein
LARQVVQEIASLGLARRTLLAPPEEPISLRCSERIYELELDDIEWVTDGDSGRGRRVARFEPLGDFEGRDGLHAGYAGVRPRLHPAPWFTLLVGVLLGLAIAGGAALLL